MQTPEQRRLTRILEDLGEGDRSAEDELFGLVYGELRQLAQAACRGQPRGGAVRATSIVHEAYLRLVGAESRRFSGRGHFFAFASRAMRQILTDRARRQRAEKRGGGWQRVTVDAVLESAREQEVDLLVIDEALGELEAVDPRLARVAELRLFSGLSVEECGEVLGLSRSRAFDLWRAARAFLRTSLGEPENGS